MARLAVIGTDDQLYIADPRHGGRVQLTADPSPQLWGVAARAPSSWSWPCWSPDGQRIACFEIREDDQDTGPARVHVLHVDGVRQWHCLDIDEGVPLYCQWQPDGQGLLVVVQDGAELELVHVRLDRLGQGNPVERGVPLFFTWHPDGKRVVVHTAGQHEARVVVRDLGGALPDEFLPQQPANYCAPVFDGERLVHVHQTGDVSRLVSTTDTGEDETTLLEFEGLGAILKAHRGVLFAAAPRGDGTAYRGLIRLDEGIDALSPEESLAFFPLADGVLIAQVDSDSNCLAWKRIRADGVDELCQFWPSREQLFHLRFFDQFAQSHSLVSPDGSTLVFCGHTAAGAPQGGEPSVLAVDLESGDLRTLGTGSFACFAPETPHAAG